MADLIENLIAEWQNQRSDLDPRPMGIVGRILILSKLLEQQTNAAIKSYELQYSELDVLATLRRKGSPFQLNPKQLMESVLITSGAMTACLDRLEKRFLVERIPDPSDRRGRIIKLLPAGIKLVDKAIESRFDQAKVAVSKLNVKEQKDLAKLLSKLMA